MKEMLEKIFTLLKDSEKVVFMGVGEEKLTDDGVGPYIISELLEYAAGTICKSPRCVIKDTTN